MRTPVRTGASPTAPGQREGDQDARRLARSFGDAIRVADGQRAEAVVDEALSKGLSAPAVHARVIAPAMYRIGELWEQAVLTPADEHLATAMCQRILASLYPRLQREPARSRARMLLAGVEGQHHVLGLRMVADVLEGAGHDVLFLGPDVPVSSLVEITRRHEPALVGLTVTMPLGAGRLEEALYRLQQEVRRDLPILLGGQGVPQRLLDEGWPYAGSSEDVVTCAERLITNGVKLPLAEEPPSASGLTGSAAPSDTRGIGTAEDHLSRMVGEAADVAREQARRALGFEQDSLRDQLTGLANRRAFEARVGPGGAALSPGEALLMIDLDGFKAVNDTRGHPAGDAVLSQFAEILQSSLRFGDFAGRPGGDEFAAVMAAGDVVAATGAAERIRAQAESGLAGCSVTVSVGLAMGGAPDVEGRADRALYAAKAAGGNAVRVDA